MAATKTKKRTKNPAKEKVSVAPHNWTDNGDKVLILRRCNADMSSSYGFVWPTSGAVEVNDWNPKKVCGGGLHGWPWGMGLGEGHDYSLIDDKWIVFSASPDDVVGELAGGWKCKSRRGVVVYCGNFTGAFSTIKEGQRRLMVAMASDDVPNASTGDSSNHASTGDSSNHASTGRCSKHASTGHCSNHASTGDSSKHASTGDSSNHASTGRCSKHASTGYSSNHASTGHSSNHASTGHCSKHASTGHSSNHASTGDCSKHASTGHSSNHASAGYSSNHDLGGKRSTAACAGLSSKAKGINGCSFALAWRDWKSDVIRYAVGVIGENGLKENTWYGANDKGEIVEV